MRYGLPLFLGREKSQAKKSPRGARGLKRMFIRS